MLKLEYKDYSLDFKFEAGTSRGVLKKHSVYFIRVSKAGLMPFGYGEAAPLDRLSVENYADTALELERISHLISESRIPSNETEVYQLVGELVSVNFPSVRFALEMALLDMINGGKQLIFRNDFYENGKEIPINGLIWMGEKDFMRKQVDEKLEAGYQCIKIKVGAIDWQDELELIKYLRSKSRDVIIRLDANGGFPTNEIFSRLKELEQYDIHSIEQPIMPKQPEAMMLICERSKIPIALDEELIGINESAEKYALLNYIKPSFIILKPTLLGGFASTSEWITIAESLGIDWWITSALESNVGLNAISQYVASYENISYQGLGTGQLYHNNIKSPLQIIGQTLRYNQQLNWDLGMF